MLVVEPADDGGFVATLEDYGGGSFGGDLLGRLVLAAARTCEGRELHSLHTYFLRPAPAGVPVAIRVERLREGRRLAQRRVELRHDGRLLCAMTTSFTSLGEGIGFQDVSADRVPAPEDLPSEAERARAEGWTDWAPGPLEWRWAGPPFLRVEPDEPAKWSGWVRPAAPLPGDSALHFAALAFLSDFFSHSAIARRLGLAAAPTWLVSLDHSVWAHRPVRWDEWWLVRTTTDVCHAGRALTRREVFARDGRLLASVAQEALVTEPAQRSSPRGG
jgi:acyl-CoA thioesterase-2